MDFSGFTADSHQEANPAGLLRVWKILSKTFTAEFPTKANTITGEIAQNITASLPDYFIPAEYVVPNKSASFEDNFQNDIGFNSFSHMIDFELAGFSKEMCYEIMKDMNAGAVFIVETSDETLAVLGTSKKGLIPTSTGKSGKSGTDKRGRVHKSENSGYRWPILPLSTTAKNDFLARLNGYGPFFQHNEFGFYTEFYVNSNYTIELRDSMGVKMNSVAYKPGDIIILTYAFPLNSTPHKTTSMFGGWVRATILSVDVNNVFTISVTEKALNGFSTTRVSFNKNSVKYTGLTAGTTPTHNQAPGPWVLGYTGGTLPFVANDYLFFWYTTGNGILVRVTAQFVSQVGTVVNVNLLSAASQNFNPAPAATGGWSVMKDTDYI